MNNTHGVLFKNKKFLRVHTNELLFDIVLFLYVKFFLYSIISRGKVLYQAISFNWLVFIFPFIAFFITWYTSFLAFRFTHRKNLSFIFTALFFWIPASMLIFTNQNLMKISGGTMEQIHHYWSFFGIIIGIEAGVVFGSTEKLVEEGKSVLITRLEGMAMPLGLFFFYLGFSTTSHINMIYFALAIGGGFGLIELSNKLDNNKERHVSLFYLIFRAYIFPFIIIAMLCLWQEVFIWGKINGALMEHTKLSIIGMLGYLVITGIIPIRIIMAVQPTSTPLGVATGLGSISYFFYSVVKLVTNIFG